jgi:Predicted integral membrane protein (DUF2269)
MTLAVTFTSWLLALHLLSAFALAGSLVIFWYLILASRNVDTPHATVAMGPLAGVATMVVRVGGLGTLVFGIWLAVRLDHVAVWSGWVIAAIVLWIVAVAAGSRSGAEYERAMRKAEELEGAGQTGPNSDLLALNRTSRGLGLHAIATLAVFLILIDMIWKPGASDLAGVFPRANDFSINFPLLVHITGATILVGGMLGAAAGLVLARGDERKLKLGYYSLLFVAFPGLVLTKIGATMIWHKESTHSLVGAAFPHSNDPRWIEIGGTALDGGGTLLVGALVVGWIGLRRLDGKTDFVAKVPIVGKWTGATYLKLTTAISVVLLAAYVLAIWAMSTKVS